MGEFLMASLSRNDMRKEAANGPYAGTKRPDIFVKKIKDGKSFIIGKTKTGTKVSGIEWDPVGEVLVWVNAQKKQGSSKFSQVFKDADFGGGAGSGGGADDTKYTESLQCYYCAYVFNKSKKKITSITDKELESVSRYTDTTMSLKECLSSGPKDWRDDEHDVYLKTANKLWEKFGSKVSGSVYFHRGSTFMDNVYKAKKKCQDIDKASDNPQAPGSFSHDKWNPGDIWMTTFSSSEKPLDEFTSSWGELNKKVAELAGATGGSTKLLGISLKKIGKVAAKFQEYKKPNGVEKKEYTFRGYKYGKTGDFFSSQDIYFETSADDIQFRTFGGDTSWQGEIKGSSAAAGKIGGGNVDFYTNQIMKKKFLPTGGEDVLFRETRENDFPQKLYEMYKKHNGGQLKTRNLMDYDVFLDNYNNTNKNWKHSKIVCMKFLDVIQSATNTQQNDFVNLCYLYGSSDTEQSSYFVKVY